MDLVGAWLRQLLRAGTAAAIVPLALLAALLVVALGSGGLGGLGSLGQLVAGPTAPPMDAVGRSPVADVRAAPVPPHGSDAAPARVAASPRQDSGGRAAAPALGTRAPQPGAVRQVRPASPRPSIVVTPSRPAAPVGLTPGEPSSTQPAPSGRKRPPQLTEVLSSTVNGVVVGVQTVIQRLAQALGLAPRPR